MIDEDKLREVRHLAARMRRDIILMVGVGQPGHIGGSCSSAEIVAVLYGWQCLVVLDPGGAFDGCTAVIRVYIENGSRSSREPPSGCRCRGLQRRQLGEDRHLLCLRTRPNRHLELLSESVVLRRFVAPLQET